MILKRLTSAFSIIELAIVIAVVGVLAAVTLVAYPLAQNTANDGKVREGAVKIAAALEEWAIRTDAQNDLIEWGPGSYESVKVRPDGEAYCDGDFSQNSYSWVSTGKHACTAEDMMVTSKYLPEGYINQLPQNTYTKQPNETYRIVECITDYRKFVLLYSLSTPTDEDTSEYNRIISACGIRNDEKNTYGMRGAIEILIENR